jgi:phenylpyruvate tautomerase PptA (4-oxalocrotonate tautomerase family)
MAQIKIYGLESTLAGRQAELSNSIHSSVIEVLTTPPEKRFHRFIALSAENFFFPSDRSENYLIIEISMFEGRAIATKKDLIHSLFASLAKIGFDPQDVEITIFETPRHHWGIRGQCGDELGLSYVVEV